MERLTEKTWRNLDPWECCGQDDFCKRGCHDDGGCNNGCIVPKLYDKLAQYEDAEEARVLFHSPFPMGAHLWRVTYPYRQDPKITEFVVKNFRTTGKKHRLQIEVQAVGVSGTNWMDPRGFFAKKEEAEAALKGEHNETSDL